MPRVISILKPKNTQNPHALFAPKFIHVPTPGIISFTLNPPFFPTQLADHANLILVFLDPIGKALVERTMKLVQRLSQVMISCIQVYRI